MTNVQFIATYIFNNPGARHMEIMRALRKWKGIPEKYTRRKWHPLTSDTYYIEVQNTWGRQYFSRYGKASNVYLDTHWRSIVPGKPRSGYILTSLGLSKVCSKVNAFSCGK